MGNSLDSRIRDQIKWCIFYGESLKQTCRKVRTYEFSNKLESDYLIGLIKEESGYSLSFVENIYKEVCSK